MRQNDSEMEATTSPATLDAFAESVKERRALERSSLSAHLMVTDVAPTSASEPWIQGNPDTHATCCYAADTAADSVMEANGYTCCYAADAVIEGHKC